MEGDQPMDSQAPTISENPSSGAPAEHIGAGTVTDSGGEHDGSGDGSNYAEGNMHGQHGAQAVAYESNTEVVVVGADDVGVNHENSGVIYASVGYDSMNGNAGQLGSYQGSAATKNEILSNEVMTSAAEEHAEDVNSAEEDRLWGTVHANCLDFNAWTALIEETEKVAENNILKIRKVYDAFLAEFPLCFGYWKKYADHEARLGSVEKVFEVYERAVHSVTYSVDIWLYYCMFAISTYEDPDTIRRLFERGLAFVGSDYLSYPLWDEYIRYEEAHQAWINLAMIYTRILENPIQQLDRYFNCFKELAASRPLSEIRTEEESELMARTIRAPASHLEEQVRSDAVEQSSESANAGLTEAEELVKYVTVREELYKKAKDFESKIIEFETAIRRPYFHVRPLDDPELENWHNYLDFIEKVDDINKVIKLYERCLIACANYPEFWIRYVLSMELSGNMELAYNALARASHVFVKKHPEIHLFAAKFKEMCEDFAGARSEYQFIYSEISPCLLEAIIKHANMEYRLGNKEVAYSIYEEVIAAEKDRERSQILPMLLVQYSRFLYLVAGDLEKARELLFGSLDQAQVSKPLLEAVIHLETIQPRSKRIDYLDTLVEKFISPDSDNTDVASTTDREEISCIFMEFLDLFGDALSIRKAYNQHMKLFLHQKRKSVSKKRQAEDFLASDNTKLVRPSADGTSSNQQVVGAYPNAQNQWTAGYGQRAPWPQNSQAQGHQWNPGYTSQPPFIAYGYANYTPPQVPVPTSAPQTAAYPYTPTHPVQAYPQQSYTQPSVAGATFPQQQGAAQQPYYGSYY